MLLHIALPDAMQLKSTPRAARLVLGKRRIPAPHSGTETLKTILLT